SDTVDGHDFENDEPAAQSPAGAMGITVQNLTSRTDYFIVVVAVDDSTNLSEPVAATPVTTLVSLRKDIEIPIFETYCTAGCHSGEFPYAEQNLSEGVSYNFIVNVPATTWDLDRVEPGDPANSHLYQRITTPPGGLDKMPLSSAVLTAAEIETIEQWILQG